MSYTTNYAAMGLPSTPGVNAFTGVAPVGSSASKKGPYKKTGPKPTTCNAKTIDALMSTEERKAKREAKILKTNPMNDFLATNPKGFKAQAKAIRKEIEKTKPAISAN